MPEETKPDEVSGDDSPTQEFRKVVAVQYPNASRNLYITNSICLAFGQALIELTTERWTAMSIFMRIGFFLLILGNVTNTWKAAISSSSARK